MSINNENLRNVAQAALEIMEGKIKHPNQQKLDVHEPEKDELTAKDFEMLRNKKKMKEEAEQVEEAMQKADVPAYLRKQQGEKPLTMADVKGPRKDSISSKENLAKARNEEVEELEEADVEKTATGMKVYGSSYGNSQRARREQIKRPVDDAKGPKMKDIESIEAEKKTKKKFSEMVESFSAGGIKSLFASLVKEEPTNDEFKKELDDQQAKSEGKKKQPDLAKGSVQAVKNEETQKVEVVMDELNGYAEATIEERSMTEPEMKKKEEIVKSMKKGLSGFKERYGKDAKSVMYATATKQAMKD